MTPDSTLAVTNTCPKDGVRLSARIAKRRYTGCIGPYDKDSRSLSLLSLLDTIAINVHYFDEAEFRERLKDNPFVDSLAGDVPVAVEI